MADDNSTEIYRALILRDLERMAEPWAIEKIAPTFAGDPESALSLSCDLDNPKRGIFAVALWRARIPIPAFRAYFASVWDHDHRWVIAAAKEYRAPLRSMFRYAAFELPAHLPDVVTVWRGTSYLSHAQAARGYSWTTDRDCACWFALRFADRNGRPLVLRTEVPRDEIMLFHAERNESEAVIFDRKRSLAPIDGNLEDWQAGYERYQAGKNQHLNSAELGAGKVEEV